MITKQQALEALEEMRYSDKDEGYPCYLVVSQYIEQQEEWVSVDERLPEYLEPVQIIVGDTMQSITYELNGHHDYDDWFDPHFFNDQSGELSLAVHRVKSWRYITGETK